MKRSRNGYKLSEFVYLFDYSDAVFESSKLKIFLLCNISPSPAVTAVDVGGIRVELAKLTPMTEQAAGK